MEAILETRNLKKYYGQEPNITRALDGVSISVENGEFHTFKHAGRVGCTYLRKREDPGKGNRQNER